MRDSALGFAIQESISWAVTYYRPGMRGDLCEEVTAETAEEACAKLRASFGSSSHRLSVVGACRLAW